MFDKKILCLGTNSKATDDQTFELANLDQTTNHGLISDSNFIPTDPGYYHTSIVDVSSGGIVALAKHFDQIKMLDQSYDVWSHWKVLLSTYKIMVQLEKLGYSTDFRTNESVQSIIFLSELLETNKRFCLYPWIHLLEEYGEVYLCSKGGPGMGVKLLKDIKDWRTDPEFVEVRRKMLAGEFNEKCQLCYHEQESGFTSTRVHESMDWGVKLNIKSLDDLKKFELPVFYEVRPSNKCNLQCRMCSPHNSDLIDKEYKKINILPSEIPPDRKRIWGSYDHIDIENLLPESRIYFTGGEPTIIPEFYAFLEKCIDLGRTDLDITFNTNAQKISDKLINLLNKFENVNFSVSIDGYGKVNDYIRWGSNWEKIVDNLHRIKDAGFFVSLEAIPSIWNITNLHLLYEFADVEFPTSTMFLQQTYWHDDTITIYNHPNPKLVVESMNKIKQTKMYYSDARDNKSIVDTILEYYQNDDYTCNLDTLRKFFEFNDKLDLSRNVRLVDYIPELEESRRYL
jgi:sulfatase maturation enzyme AslB (radical SAM superfamily)